MTLPRPKTADRRGFLTRLGVGGTALLTGCFGDEASTESPTPTPTPDDWRDDVTFADADREVYVEAERFQFVPGTGEPIRVGVDETVGLALRSTDGGYHDGGHGLSIPAYEVGLRAPPSTVDAATFRVSEAGEFAFHCSVYCGGGHEEMGGTLLVEDG